MYSNPNSNNNPKHFTIPPPPNPYPHLQHGQPPPPHSMIMNPYHSYTYQPPANSMIINPYHSLPTDSSKRPLPNDTRGPPHKKLKPSPDGMSAHELFAHRLSSGGSDNNPILPFQNPYQKNQRIQVREGELPMWLDGTVIDIGYDWIQVRYVGFSNDYDSTIFVDPNHIHFNKYKTRLLSNNNIKSEFKIDNNNNNESDHEMDIGLNDKLLLSQLEQLVIAKREELNNKLYNNVINDIHTFLNGFDITNIPVDKYGIVSELYVIYASCLGQKSEFNQAIKYCKKAINISPQYYKGYTTLAILYEFQQKYNDADKQYKIALKLDMSQDKKRQIQQSYNKLLIMIKNVKKECKKEVMSDISDIHSDSDTDSEDIPIISKDNHSNDSNDSSNDDEMDEKQKKRGVKGTTLDERVMDVKLMSSVQKSAYENRVRNPNGFYYRFNDSGEKQKNGGWSNSEHKSFMKRVLEFGVNIEWGFFSQVVAGRVGYQCSNYWRKLMDDGYVKDENYVMEKGKNGKMKRRQLKKKEIQNNNDNHTDEYFDKFRRYQFTVLQDPSGTFNLTPCKHPKAPNGGSGVIVKKKKGRKGRKKKSKKVKKYKHKKIKRKKKKKKRRKRRLSDSSSDDSSFSLSDMSIELSSEEEESEYETTDNKRKKSKKKRIKRERIKKEKRKRKSKNKSKNKKIKKEEPTSEFLCPISYELMQDPVMVKQSGWTYERSAIENWIKENGTDPNTRDICCMDDLIPNRTLRDAIVKWKQRVGYVKTEK